MPSGGKLTIETMNADLDSSYMTEHFGVTPQAQVIACGQRRWSPQGTTMRPGAPFAPFSVWQLLQSPLLCAVTMARVAPLLVVTFAV